MKRMATVTVNWDIPIEINDKEFEDIENDVLRDRAIEERIEDIILDVFENDCDMSNYDYMEWEIK